jgi:hypothetical protein
MEMTMEMESAVQVYPTEPAEESVRLISKIIPIANYRITSLSSQMTFSGFPNTPISAGDYQPAIFERWGK